VRLAAALAVIAGISALAAACTDPGCIRNSECQIDFRCIEHVCVRASTDAGAAPSTSMDGSAPVTRDASPERDASKPNTRDASTSKPPPTGDDAGS
jgi:hypothetical protein